MDTGGAVLQKPKSASIALHFVTNDQRESSGKTKQNKRNTIN